jgi:DNA mismatch repair protein MutL
LTLRHGERTVYDLPPAADWRGRIEAFFGAELAAALIPVTSRDGNLALEGFAANPSHSRSNPRMQYLFLNGRAIRDRSLQHALGEAYRGLLLTGRFPIAFLNIAMPPDLVDVNVHPTKLEVRFQESGRLYSVLLGALRTQFLTTDLTARLQPAPASEAAQAVDGEHAAKMRRELVDWAKGRLEESVAQAASAPGAAPAGELSVAPPPARATSDTAAELPFAREWRAGARGPLELARFDRSRIDPGSPRNEEAYRGEPFSHGPAAAAAPASAAPASTAPASAVVAPAAQGAEGRRFDSAEDRRDSGVAGARAFGGVSALQVHNRYLIAESDDGMIVIDQHALHERILYEHLREKVLSGAIESQALLVPEPVDLNPSEAAAVIEAREVLGKLGVTVAPFGGDTVLVSSYPAMLANVPPAEVLRDLVDHLLSGGKQPDRRDLLDELLHMISCKAAIKAGDRLTGEEIAALLEQRHLAQDSHHCPHGRPTALIFTREELDRQFKRT